MSSAAETKSLKTPGGLEFKLKAWLNFDEEAEIEVKMAAAADDIGIEADQGGTTKANFSLKSQTAANHAQILAGVSTVIVELDGKTEDILERFKALRSSERNYITAEIQKIIDDSGDSKKK